jgi:hypothetical protein
MRPHYQHVVPAIAHCDTHRHIAPIMHNQTPNNGGSREPMSNADRTEQRIRAPPSSKYHSREYENEKCHVAQAILEVPASDTMQTPVRKAVHWSPLPTQRGSTPTSKGSILRYTPSIMRQTTPFNVCLRLGGEEYTVRFESLPVIHATLGNFEAELMNAVPIKYKELLHLNFAAGYPFVRSSIGPPPPHHSKSI